MQNNDSRLLFEIDGVPRKRGLKKLRSYIAVYADRIEIELEGENDVYTRDNIIDIYIQEPVISEVDSRTTVIDFYEEGDQNYYELEDSTFPNLAEKMERILETEWSYILDKCAYPKTVKWFVACCAIVHIESQQNCSIFGGQYKEPDSIAGTRKSLFESWGFNNKQDLLEMLPKLYDGRSVNQFKDKAEQPGRLDDDERELLEHIIGRGGERCMWAWDLQRMILLSAYGYVCDWLSREDSLDWCLKAGLKLQSIYRSWDDFIDCYLHGYCFWSGESLDDEDSEAYERKQVYEYYKHIRKNPWQVTWHHPLINEW